LDSFSVIILFSNKNPPIKPSSAATLFSTEFLSIAAFDSIHLSSRFPPWVTLPCRVLVSKKIIKKANILERWISDQVGHDWREKFSELFEFNDNHIILLEIWSYSLSSALSHTLFRLFSKSLSNFSAIFSCTTISSPLL